MKHKGYCEICESVPVVDEEIAEQNPDTIYICYYCFKKHVEVIIKESEE